MDKKTLQIGDQISKTFCITADQIDAFAELTKDYNPIHMEKEAANKQRFFGRVVHGLYVNSLVSTVMGMELPGPGTVLMDQNVTFQHPVIEGDTIQITVRLVSVEERYKNYIGTIQIECKNQEDLIVLSGTCHQLMPKSNFQIGGITDDES